MAQLTINAGLVLLVAIFVAGNEEIDYPDVVSIFGSAPADDYTTDAKSCFGFYSKMPGESSRGKPVWKHIDRDNRFFFCGQNDWQCGYKYGDNHGGYINAPGERFPQSPWKQYLDGAWHEEPTITFESLVTAGQKQVEVEETDKMTLTCRTPKPIALCTFIAPNGKKYGRGSIGQERISYVRGGSKKTECGIKISHTLKEDGGIWRCDVRVFTSKTKTLSGNATAVVKVSPSTVTKDETQWKGTVGGEASLIYSTNLTISDCTFITPSGKELQLTDEPSYEEGRIAFFGPNPLSQCGVKLKAVEDADFGEWMCQITALTADFKVKHTNRGSVLRLDNSNTQRLDGDTDSPALHPSIVPVSISVSLLLAIVVIISLVVYYKKKSTPTLDKQDSNPRETWTANNVKETSAKGGSEEQANYFDPSYDYMGTE